jgi:hypothetical protein
MRPRKLIARLGGAAARPLVNIKVPTTPRTIADEVIE